MWLVFNIGYIECGVSSNVVAVYPHKREADAVAAKLNENSHGETAVKTRMKYSN